ncbi:MAG TPA: hypothetical protein VN802_02495 [Stellaceae bacterium]|nr:hypothetical protein [Stellaceae bacterium]
MTTDKPETAVGAMRRKLRAIGRLIRDPAATEHERENAETLKNRLEAQLKEAGAPKGDWSDVMFRLGQTAKAIKQSTAPAAPSGDWTDGAFRLGKAVRRMLKK